MTKLCLPGCSSGMQTRALDLMSRDVTSSIRTSLEMESLASPGSPCSPMRSRFSGEHDPLVKLLRQNRYDVQFNDLSSAAPVVVAPKAAGRICHVSMERRVGCAAGSGAHTSRPRIPITSKGSSTSSTQNGFGLDAQTLACR